MAGQPKARRLEIELTVRAKQIDDNATTLDAVCAWLEKGGTVVSLAKDVGDAVGEEYSVDVIYAYLKRVYGKGEYTRRFAAARKEGSHAVVEEATQILDDLPNSADRDRVAVAKAQADIRLWRAERYNRAELGGDKQVAVQINVGSLHIDAMRQRAIEGSEIAAPSRAFISDASSPALPSTTNDTTVVDYQVISDDSATR